MARPEASGSIDGITLSLIGVPHGGKGAAVRAGMLAAEGDLIIFADADMATPPDQLPLLVEALADNDVALGSRIQPDGSDMRASQPVYRRLLGKAFHALAAAWVIGPVKDTQCGFKGFTREAAHDLFPRQRVTSIVFDVEVIYLARRRGYRMAVVPIHWYDRRGSRLKARPGLALRVAWDCSGSRSSIGGPSGPPASPSDDGRARYRAWTGPDRSIDAAQSTLRGPEHRQPAERRGERSYPTDTPGNPDDRHFAHREA